MKNIRLFLIASLLFAAHGCGPAGPSIAPVTGEVKRPNGDPLSEVSVVFYPANGPSVVAKTDAAGVFKAEVAVGKAKVAIIDKGEASSADTSPAASAAPKKPRFNPKYNSGESSGIVADVGKNSEKVVFIIE